MTRYIHLPHNRATTAPPPYDHRTLREVNETERLLRLYRLTDIQHERLNYLMSRALFLESPYKGPDDAA